MHNGWKYFELVSSAKGLAIPLGMDKQQTFIWSLFEKPYYLFSLAIRQWLTSRGE